ncbi:hypothetical protein [Streptomyces novaecaesareae]|uniref:hypothetical protein n=1 Tax=Streptomyces novaecaesareae TaxID=68244 RepID=UPI00052718D0|nr:hypothetical protein [Streptomyces novaecaesareae]
MTHNDVARRTAPEMPARRLIPRTPACDSPVPFVELAQRALVRALRVSERSERAIERCALREAPTELSEVGA